MQLLVDACATPARSPADCRAPRAGADPPLPTARAPAQRAVCDRSAPLQARPRHPFAPSHACPAASAHLPPGECRLAVGELVCPQAPQSAPLAARRSRSRIYAHVAATPCAGLAATLRRRHARSPSARSISSTRRPCPSSPGARPAPHQASAPPSVTSLPCAHPPPHATPARPCAGARADNRYSVMARSFRAVAADSCWPR